LWRTWCRRRSRGSWRRASVLNRGPWPPYAVATARNLTKSLATSEDRNRRHVHRLIDLREPVLPEEEALVYRHRKPETTQYPRTTTVLPSDLPNRVFALLTASCCLRLSRFRRKMAMLGRPEPRVARSISRARSWWVRAPVKSPRSAGRKPTCRTRHHGRVPRADDDQLTAPVGCGQPSAPSRASRSSATTRQRRRTS
jgi:hypothetical protein